MYRAASACVLLTTILLLALASPSFAVIYVKWDSPGPTFDGTSWDTALHTVQEGLNAATSGDEVWVAAGIYVGEITLKASVGLYGGFVGTETSRDQRDWSMNVTTLDGNRLGGVVTSPFGATGSTVIDGFVIRNGSSPPWGGGVSCVHSSPTITNNTITGNSSAGIWCWYSSSPTIKNNTISGNSGDGGIYCDYDCSPTITNNTITGNSASEGGGVHCCSSSPTIADNTITGNNASEGGGIYCDQSSSPTITDNTITGNSASEGGGIHCDESSPMIANNTIAGNSDGAIWCGMSSSPTIRNNTISGNGSELGGIYCGDYCSPTVTNNTITGNSGDAIYCRPSSCPAITNNIVAFNESGIFKYSDSYPTLRNNCFYNPDGRNYYGLTAGMGDIQVDPGLCAVEYGQVHIQPGSPCTDAGDDAVVGTGWTDIDGQIRIQGAHVDIGADESDGTTCTYTPVTVRVSPNGDDANDGSSWALAKRTVQAGVNAASAVGGDVWVAGGTYSERIALPLHLYMYGGFSGIETELSQRPAFPRVAPDPHETILDGGGGGTVVMCISRGYRLCAIDGFVIRNGSASDGGGISCEYSSPTIANNRITGNSASKGGGIWCEYSDPKIANNTIRGNSGGGIRCYRSYPRITDNTITENSSSEGAGIYCDYYSYPTITGNTITGNSTRGLYCYLSSPTIADNTITGNSGGGIRCEDASPTIADNTITGNSGGGIRCYRSYPRITDNTITENSGGGIWCWDGSSPTIRSNTITGNSASEGGGIFCESSTITNNTIAGNSASYGGGIYCGSSTITNNTITGNSASYCGGGISCGSSTITSNTIAGNSASEGGGIRCVNSTSTIADNIVAFNSSGICKQGSFNPTLRSNCVYNPDGYNYSRVPPGKGDFSLDPLFVCPTTSDFHLKVTSPCIDAGWNGAPGLQGTDIDGEPRIMDCFVDIGADEYPFGTSLSNTKPGRDTAPVWLSSCIVTAVFDGCFYIEAEDRSCGIRVEKADHGLEAGDRVNVTGTLKTNADGERYIEASSIEKTGTGSIAPMHINARALGGGNWFYNPSTGAGQCGVVGGLGLNNIGLLVTTWGKVSYLGGAYALDLGEDNTAKILAEGMSFSGKDMYVRITGISSCYRNTDGLHPTIRVVDVTPL